LVLVEHCHVVEVFQELRVLRSEDAFLALQHPQIEGLGFV
jgi:hypothetical protein